MVERLSGRGRPAGRLDPLGNGSAGWNPNVAYIVEGFAPLPLEVLGPKKKKLDKSKVMFYVFDGCRYRSHQFCSPCLVGWLHRSCSINCASNWDYPPGAFIRYRW